MVAKVVHHTVEPLFRIEITTGSKVYCSDWTPEKYAATLNIASNTFYALWRPDLGLPTRVVFTIISHESNLD